MSSSVIIQNEVAAWPSYLRIDAVRTKPRVRSSRASTRRGNSHKPTLQPAPAPAPAPAAASPPAPAPAPAAQRGSWLASLAYFLRTLYLFTLSDHLTFVVPQAMFGIVGALSGPALTRQADPSVVRVLLRAPAVLFWTWLHTLLFTMHNQSSPEAVVEDRLNKPFRPIASGRISIGQTRALMWALIPLTFVAALYLGGVPETVFLLVGNFMYNEGRGSDNSIVVRNWSIATAFALYGAGALEVACGGFSIGLPGAAWTLTVAAVIMTTMHVQDLKDQPGDSTRGRRTVPLVFGDAVARWSILVPVVFWTVAAAWYWHTPLPCYLPSLALSAGVCFRLLAFRDTQADRRTWKLWSVWLMSLYHLPLIYSLTA